MNAVLWDLDDTLLNTAPLRMRCLEKAYRECMGSTIDPLALWQSHGGGTLEGLAMKLLGEDYRRFVDCYRRLYFERPGPVAAHAGVPLVLETLLDHAVPMAVVTSKISWGATEELQRCGLLRFFHSVVGYDDTELHKPEPDPLFEAMDRMALDPDESVLFVGDSPADIAAARDAGCASIGALWGTLEANMLREMEPDYLAEAPGDVLEIVGAEAVNG